VILKKKRHIASVSYSGEEVPDRPKKTTFSKVRDDDSKKKRGIRISPKNTIQGWYSQKTSLGTVNGKTGGYTGGGLFKVKVSKEKATSPHRKKKAKKEKGKIARVDVDCRDLPLVKESSTKSLLSIERKGSPSIGGKGADHHPSAGGGGTAGLRSEVECHRPVRYEGEVQAGHPVKRSVCERRGVVLSFVPKRRDFGGEKGEGRIVLETHDQVCEGKCLLCRRKGLSLKKGGPWQPRLLLEEKGLRRGKPVRRRLGGEVSSAGDSSATRGSGRGEKAQSSRKRSREKKKRCR